MVLTQARCTSPLWLSSRHISQSELATSSRTANRVPFSKLSCSLSYATQWHNVSTNLYNNEHNKTRVTVSVSRDEVVPFLNYMPYSKHAIFLITSVWPSSDAVQNSDGQTQCTSKISKMLKNLSSGVYKHEKLIPNSLNSSQATCHSQFLSVSQLLDSYKRTAPCRVDTESDRLQVYNLRTDSCLGIYCNQILDFTHIFIF